MPPTDAVYQSAEHVLSFLKGLRAELAFYLGCLNLKERLDEIGERVAFPEPSRAGTRAPSDAGTCATPIWP